MDGTKQEITAEELHHLQHALDTMPLKYRTPFSMRRFGNFTYPEIADRLGITVEQVEQRIAAAIYQLDCAIYSEGKRPWWRLW
jgi:RNA polymerase sigma factor (sigma-70 family)